MKYIRFHRALRAVIDRADTRHRKATGKALSLSMIARDVGISLILLTRVLDGEKVLDTSHLLPLLVYLGTDEEEQRFLFHLAEIAQRESAAPKQEKGLDTDRSSAALFRGRNDTDPATERITEKRPLS
jgi:hypothetical protein